MEFEQKTWYNDGIVPDDAPEGTVAPALDADNMNRIEGGIAGLCTEMKKNNQTHLMIETGQFSGDGKDTRVISFSKIKPEVVMIRNIKSALNAANIIRGQTRTFVYLGGGTTPSCTANVSWGDYDVTIY